MTTPNLITPNHLSRLIGTPDCPFLIDVCTPEDFAEDPRVVPTALRYSFENIATLAPDIKDARCVVICQKGKKLSQGAAAVLRSLGVKAEALDGGVQAWRNAGLPLIPAEAMPNRGTYWVTRHRPKVDRIATPWLIRRFIDPDARFLFVAPSAVLDVADKFGAVSFDAEGASFHHGPNTCTFDALLTHTELQTSALSKMAEIVRSADGASDDMPAQAAGVLALSLGLSRVFKDDLAQLEAGLVLYDALYRWCRDAQSETHGANNHGSLA